MKKNFDVIVIGGGPSGMMSAGRAGELGAQVLLIEKNDHLGKKLSLTGGRRCNITNAETDNRVFLENFPESKQFLFSPFSQFNVKDTFEFFETLNLPLVIEDRKRAFPKSQKADDVRDALEKYMKQTGNVEILLETVFKSFKIKENRIVGITTSSGTFLANKIVVATGGLAVPATGSTGDGLSALNKIGHTIKAPNPNLAPLCTNSKWIHDLSGTSVDDIGLRFIQKNKTQFKVRGRILFTHFGISGPMVINSAHKVKCLLKKGEVEASIDLFPDCDLGSLDAFFIKLFDEQKNKKLKSILNTLLQKSLVEAMLNMLESDMNDMQAHSITKQQRKSLVQIVKDLRFPIQGTMGLEWSIVADGGVDPKEIDFKTMASRLHPNIYLTGDIIDINRPSGGFSLQLCWTTGFVAGTHSAKKNKAN
ncbi:NAD(P)/FAD-dependent oxidoreductase [Patescibacteria group bacterium]|nr:NAD(P)/FAD-dependent oxidoreductase [Patescibacteria group bacterium]